MFFGSTADTGFHFKHKYFYRTNKICKEIAYFIGSHMTFMRVKNKKTNY